MSVVLNNEFNKLHTMDVQAYELFGSMASMKVIPTDAKDEELLEDLKNLNENETNKSFKTLLTSVSFLKQEHQLELLHLIASLTMTARANENMKMGGDGHDNIVEYDEELPEKKENKFLSNRSLFYSIVGFFIGLSLIYYAFSNMKALGENVGVFMDKESFINLFLRPKETAEKTFATIMNNIAARAAEEIKFQASRECGTADGSYISNMITALWNPAGKFNCIYDSSLETTIIEATRTKRELANNLSYIISFARIGTALTWSFGGSTFIILDGRNNNKISKFIMNTVKTVPGLKKLLPSSNERLAIEDVRGGRRKSRKRGRKSKKSRKGKKGRKSRRKH